MVWGGKGTRMEQAKGRGPWNAVSEHSFLCFIEQIFTESRQYVRKKH